MQPRVGNSAGRNLAICHKLVLSLESVFLEGGGDYIIATKPIQGSGSKSLTQTHIYLVPVLGFLFMLSKSPFLGFRF